MAGHSSIEVDELDRRLVQALQLDGRLPFSRIAAALGVSEQTIARRYRRLSDLGIVRIVGLHNAWRSHDSLFLRISTQPGFARHIGEALAMREDVSWVSVALGDTEMTCALHAADVRDRQSLVAERLPKVSRVVGVTSFVILHKFPRDPRSDWTTQEQALTQAEIDALKCVPVAPGGHEGTVQLTAEDRTLVAQLKDDGRRPVANLAAAIGRSESYVAKRVEALRTGGHLLIVTAVAMEPLGFTTTAMIWITVPPTEISRVGAQLATHAEVTFAGAVSGPANLVVAVTCHDNQDLYRYITERVGAITSITHTEVVADQLIKRHGAVIQHHRLRAYSIAQPSRSTR
ncbi:MAG TPA: Lrp/AsnC family transcriptional regulator [Solirubrobacteraceae bacterium]|nr:Lrp/AsnC family transcriptional regulator [Solirubrobacteraceae bacterium]